MRADPALRASDADRERVATALGRHHAEGRLTVADLTERVGRALAAVTVADLDRLTGDLPRLPAPARWDGGPARSEGRRRGPAPGLAYAGFWARAGALGLDTLLIGAIIGGLSLSGVRGAPIGWVALLLWPCYFIAGWAVGATPGMLPLGLRVVAAADGRRPGMARAVARLGGWVISAWSMGVGFAWAAFDRRKQGWHDKVAGTVVVQRLAPGEPRPGAG
ncbi:MAG TPA: RDD family protein [Candidatus Micrarchaeia archaeon]|nr:RDD family protein [Candidatus Micrarchaeia archaeon]